MRKGTLTWRSGDSAGWVVCALLLAAFGALAAPGVARAQCPEADADLHGRVRTDVRGAGRGATPGGWTDASKYSTIQLADFNGDGKDELFARNDQGLEIYWFDTSVGQWRPQVDADDVPQVLTDFRSPLPERDAGDRLDQAAVLLDDPGRRHRRPAGRGDPGALRGRDARLQVHPADRDGHASTAAAGRESGPAARSATPRGYGDASLYSDDPRREVQDRGRTADVRAHEQLVPRVVPVERRAWTQVTRTNPLGEFDIDGFSDPACAQPACYLDLHDRRRRRRSTPAGQDDTEEIMGRLGFGVSLWDIGAFEHLGSVLGGLDTDQLGAFADVPGPIVISRRA